MEHYTGGKFVNLNESPPTTHLSDKLNHNTLGKSREYFTHSYTPKASPTDFLGFLTFHRKDISPGWLSNHFCPRLVLDIAVLHTCEP